MNNSDNKRLAHVTEGEVVIPKEVAAIRPELVAHVAETLKRMGGDPTKLQVGRGYINPKTGIEEFATRDEVRQAYLQILGREPDAKGLNWWMNDPNFSMANFALAAVPELKTSASNYQNDLKKLQSTYGTLQNQYGTLQNQFGSLQQQQSDWQNKYGTLSDQFGMLQNQYGTIEQQLSDRQNQYSALQNQFNTVQQDLAKRQLEYGSLQDQYNMLNKEYGKIQRDANGAIVGASTVDDGSTFNFGDASTAGTGTTGVVYGPDGTAYSSVAAAVAAGVTNYSFNRPSTAATPNIGSTDATSSAPTATAPAPNTFNFGGGLISNANKQLFTQPTGARVNPFAIR